ncbi:unnamed protein product [Brugia timori]|uniref:Transmembrane protein n=1 Tax=Brugia timori TaxID=42155 RepID=A0A0R3QV40_9BILA|nr:unnamed protein product [Brugia timori]
MVTVTWMIMFGNLMNNFIDGISNGAAFANLLARGFSVAHLLHVYFMPLEAKECQTRLTLQAHFSAPIDDHDDNSDTERFVTALHHLQVLLPIQIQDPSIAKKAFPPSCFSEEQSSPLMDRWGTYAPSVMSIPMSAQSIISKHHPWITCQQLCIHIKDVNGISHFPNVHLSGNIGFVGNANDEKQSKEGRKRSAK